MPFGSVKLRDGNEIPLIAFGTGSTMKFKDVTDYVEQALENGFSHIDTAPYYQTEQYVGIAIRECGFSRSDLYITTKYSGGTTVEDSIQNSLRNLGVTYVDLYLVHNPSFLDSFEAGWRSFENLKKDGLAKSIGVSNFSVEQLQELWKVSNDKPVVNQIRLHPYNYAEQKDILNYCAGHGIVVEAYGSLNSITNNPGGPVDAVVNAAAKRINATPNQVIFAWVRSKGAVIVTTSRSKARLQEYLETADLPPLTPEEIAAIDEAGAQGPPSSFLKACGLRCLGARRTQDVVALFMLALIFLVNIYLNLCQSN